MMKLGIHEGMTIVVLHSPGHLESLLGPLPRDVTLRHNLRQGLRCDMLIGFVTERTHLARNLPRLLEGLPREGILWIAWPKKASGIPNDMSDNAVRGLILPTGWVDTKVCAIDDTWSALKFVLRRELRSGRRQP